LTGLVTRRQNPTPSCADRLAANVLTARAAEHWVRRNPADAAQRKEDVARGHFIKQKALAKANAYCVLEKSNRLSRLQFFAELPNGTRSKGKEQHSARNNRRRLRNGSN
jgi:hypothetical protein